MANPNPGQIATLTLNFYNEESGTLTDPTSLTLDITTGGNVGQVADVPGGGPFAYPGVVTRVSTGVYSYQWLVTNTLDWGSYTANWSVVFEGDTFLVTENFYIGGSASGYVPPPIGECGYWTGSCSYTPTYTNIPNTVTFGETDANGTQWFWLELDGWDGSDVSGQVVQRASDHGGWPTQQFYAPRSLTWSVLIIAPSQELRDVARAQLQSAISVSDLSTFTYNEPIPKQAMVRRSGRIAETYATLNEAAFAIPLICPDPRKYGTSLKTATATFLDNTTSLGVTVPFTVPWSSPAQPPQGSVTVTNAGDFETRPVISITGPVISPTLVSITSGKEVSWTGLTLAAGDTLVVDFDSRQAILDGNALRPADFTSAWWVMEPGDTEIQLGGQTSGGSTITVTWRDAWI